MNIIGPDALAFGVDDVGACRDYLTAFGLKPIDVDDAGGFFEALDGTGVLVRRRDDPRLPAPMETAAMLRQTIYGVADQATVNAIGDELAKDRQVERRDDGSVEAKDDHGFALKFQVTKRRELKMEGEKVNAPGSAPQRGPNRIGVWEDDAGETAHAFARRLLRARHSVGGGLLCAAPGLQDHRPFQRNRSVSAPGRARKTITRSSSSRRRST